MKQLHRVGWIAGVMMTGMALRGTALAAPPSADMLKSMLACRGIQDPGRRLACFDDRSSALDTAAAKGDVAVIDRETVRQARKQNFGRQNPKPIIPLNEKDVEEINVVVQTAAQNSDGGWVMTMTDGSRWVQTDSVSLGRLPRPGSKVYIQKAALGSFKARVDGGPAFRARRIG